MVLTPLDKFAGHLAETQITFSTASICIRSSFHCDERGYRPSPGARLSAPSVTVRTSPTDSTTKTKVVDLVATYPLVALTSATWDPSLPITTTNRRQRIGPKVHRAARIIDIQHYAPQHRANLNLSLRVDPRTGSTRKKPVLLAVLPVIVTVGAQWLEG